MHAVGYAHVLRVIFKAGVEVDDTLLVFVPLAGADEVHDGVIGDSHL